MNFRTTYILFGVFGGLVLLLGLVLVLNPSKPPDTKYVLPTLHEEGNPVASKDVETVTIERTKPEAQKTISFQRDEATNRWKMVEPLTLGPDRVDDNLVDRLVNQVMNARIDDLADTQGGLKPFGLDEPSAKVTLKKGDKSWTLFLGNKVETKGGQTSVQYVTSSDRKEPMAVRLSSLDLLGKSPYELRARDLLADHADEIRRITLSDGTHTPVILKRDAATQWRFEQPGEYGPAEYQGEATPPAATTAKTLTAVKALIDILATFKVDVKAETKDGKAEVAHDFVSEDGRNLEQYGLTGDKLFKIKVTRALSGGAGKETEVEKTLVFGKPVDEKGEKIYAMLEGENHVVKVAAANLDLLKKVLDNPGSLRNRDLMAVSESNIDAVKIAAPSNELELFRAGPPPGTWKLFRGSKADAADSLAVSELLRALTAKGQVKGFPDPKTADLKALQLDPPVATISLWEQGVKKEEKKDDDKKDGDKKPEGEKKDDKPTLTAPDKPTVKLLLGKRENGMVTVKRETASGSTLLTVPDSIVDLVNKPAVAYLDKTIPPFSADVTKVTLARGGEQFTIEKEKDKEAWKLTAPEAMASKPANSLTVSSIVNTMRRSLIPDKIVAEKATPELEEQYGLKTPLTWVSLSGTADDKPEERVYLFGKEDGDNVYFKIKDRDPIYLVKKFAVGILQSELRDTALFRFDRDKVQVMKVEGWAGLFPGNWQTVELERKSATDWKVKSTTAAAPISNLDPKKAEDFLNFVLRQRVDKFIGKAGPQPQKMELTDDVLIVELTVEGEKEKVTLRVGGETPDQKGWFARSSVLPDEPFILAKQDQLPKDQTNDQFAKIRSQTPTQFFSAAPK